MTGRQRAWLLPPAALCLIGGILAGRGLSSPLLPWLACLPALAALFLTRGGLRFAACLALSFTLGAAAGQVSFHPALPPEGEYEVRGIICEEVTRGKYGQVRTALTHVSLDGKPLSSGAWWTFYTDNELPDDLVPGKEVCFRGTVYAPSGADNPDGYDFREELLRRGITVGAYGADGLSITAASGFSFMGSAAALRHRISLALEQVMGEEAGGYASGLLLGIRTLIPSEDRAAFARLGIAHILSVSGFHTGLLIALLALLFRLLRLPPRVRPWLYGLILLLYCGLCGMSQPVLRASLMLFAGMLGKKLQRPRIQLHLVCAVMAGMLLISPVQVTGISFQLTFCAMAGIALIMPWLDGLNPFSRRIPRAVWSSLAVTVAAGLGLLLPELYHYQKLPLVSLVVNLPAGIAASALILTDWIILLTLPVRFLAEWLAIPGKALTDLFLQAVRMLGSLPGITLWTHASTWLTVLGMIPVGYSLCGLFRPSRWRRIICLLSGTAVVILSLLPQPHHTTEYIQFSVGNADAAVLWDRDRVYVMDTGTDDGVVSGFLRRNRLTPDAVILTHLHTDHAGGLLSLMDDEIPIPVIYLPEGAKDQAIHEDVLAVLKELEAAGTEIRTLSRGDSLSLPSGTLTVLWPEKGGTRRMQDANRYSLVSLLKIRGVSFLHTGDIEGIYEHYSAVPADLMKAPHHGSAGSTFPETLERVRPQAVLLSCASLSREEAYAERLGEIPLRSTASGGALTVRFEEDAFGIVSFKDVSQQPE